ncbi:MAG: outer membrane lipoprotein LolB [Gammaproteobacteria bacterium]|nr:outer membrane lipoprotein LolB [Gammaproteobacteria bacterium]
MLLAVGVMALGLGGCVSRPTVQETGLEFRLTGRIGLVAEEGAVTANYVWRQYANGVEIELWGPLGQGRTRVVGEGAALTVYTAGGARLDGEAARALVRREFGLAAPVELLSNWILGRPAPDWPVESLGEGSFTQLGWHVVLSGFRDMAGRRVPGRLVASRGGRRVTVLCREWYFAGQN